jgi:glyoxylase-like metal-dependent hydrolase (beta-lactamase superfamily II)
MRGDPVPDFEITDLGGGVSFVRGRDVNWLLVREGTDLTVVDGGYPGYQAAFDASVQAVGAALGDIRAMLLTHAHIDHMGSANRLHEQHGVPVYVDPVEVAHARRERLEQAGPADIARVAWRPGVLPWSMRITRAGALRHEAIPSAQPFASSGPLDVPGRPLPVATHGHTSGHSGYLFPSAGVIATGDALVTGHACTRVEGPHVLPGYFNHGDPLPALTALADVDADQIAPGHGPARHLPIAEAVAQARARHAG